MTKTIYLVVGDNGEGYSDHYTWNVCAFADKEMAQKHVEFMTEKKKADTEAYLQKYKYHHDNTYYQIEEIELVDEVESA